MWWWLIVWCSVTTWAMAPGYANGWMTLKLVAYLLGGTVLASSPWWWRGLAPGLRNRWAGLFALYALERCLWTLLAPNCFRPQTLARLVPWQWVLTPILPCVVLWLGLLVVDACLRAGWTEDDWCAVALGIVCVAGSLAGYGLLQWCLLDPWHFARHAMLGLVGTERALLTTLGNPMLTGNYLAIVLPLTLIATERWLVVMRLLCCVALWLSHSQGSLLAALLGCSVFWGWARQYRTLGVVWLLAVLGLLGLVLTHQAQSFCGWSGRGAIWQLVLAAWWHVAPWCGVGLGGVAAAFEQGAWDFAWAHNDLLQLGCELGLLGVGLCLAAVGSLLWRIWQTPKTTVLMGWVSAGVAAVGISLVSFPWHIPPLTVLCLSVWAALEALCPPSGGRHASVSA